MEKVSPNFLIVGAAKAGTTSLYYWLKQHPEIFMPDVKEPSFFLRGYGVSEWEEYLRLFVPGRDKKAVGEASAGYVAAPESPQWIRRMLAEVKIIIILRDPVRRAFSLYNWMIREGYEVAGTFEEALRREPERLRDQAFRQSCPQYFPDYLYFTTGLYFEQVKRYYQYFEPTRIKLLFFENLIKDPVNLCREVFDFLSVDTSFTPLIKPFNKGVLPRSVALQYRLRTGAACWPFSWMGKRRSRTVIRALMNLNVRLGSGPITPRETFRQLRQRYQADVTQLAEFLSVDLSQWLR